MQKFVRGILYVGVGVVAGAVVFALITLLPIGVDQGDASVVGAILGGIAGLGYGAHQDFA